MSLDTRGEGEDPRRFEAARQAVRAVAAAFRTLRLYPLGHVLTSEALQAAERAVHAYAGAYGSLAVTASPRGVAFDFRPQPYEDDVVADLARAMRAQGVPAVRFLPSVTFQELGEVLAVFHQPIHQIERGGGMGRVLTGRGVQNVVVDDLVVAAPPGEDLLEPLLAAARSGDTARVAAYLRQTGGNEAAVRPLFRALDRRIITAPRALQAAVWKTIGQSLASLRAAWQSRLCAMIVQSVDEPWAASLASQWPPVLAASLVGQTGRDPQEQGRRVADALRLLHRSVPHTPLPPVVPVEEAQRRAGREAFGTWTPARLRAYAVRALDHILPQLSVEQLPDVLSLIERAAVQIVEEGDMPGVLAVVRALTTAARDVTDVRRDLIQACLSRVISLGARDLFHRTLLQPPTPEHPFVQAMAVAPEETLRILLELAGGDEPLEVQRGVIDLISVLSTGHADLLGERALDPRSPVARAAVAVLGRIAGQGALPYLRAALGHADAEVKREAMRALSALGTADAMEALAEALLSSAGETQAAAAHWLGVIGRPESAGVLITVLEATPITEQVEVKRELIRALGRLGTEDAVRALRRVAAAEAPLLRRRQADELRQEALAALARLEGAG